MHHVRNTPVEIVHVGDKRVAYHMTFQVPANSAVATTETIPVSGAVSYQLAARQTPNPEEPEAATPLGAGLLVDLSRWVTETDGAFDAVGIEPGQTRTDIETIGPAAFLEPGCVNDTAADVVIDAWLMLLW